MKMAEEEGRERRKMKGKREKEAEDGGILFGFSMSGFPNPDGKPRRRRLGFQTQTQPASGFPNAAFGVWVSNPNADLGSKSMITGHGTERVREREREKRRISRRGEEKRRRCLGSLMAEEEVVEEEKKKMRGGEEEEARRKMNQ